MAGRIRIRGDYIPEISDSELSESLQGITSFNRIRGTTSRTHNRVMKTSVYTGYDESELTVSSGDLFAEGRIRIEVEGVGIIPLYTVSNSKIIRPILQYTITQGSRIIPVATSRSTRSAMVFAMAGGGGSGGTGTNSVVGTGGSGGGGGGFIAGYITTGQVDAIRPYLSLSAGSGGGRPSVHSTPGNKGGDSAIVGTNSSSSITSPVNIAKAIGGSGGSGGSGAGGSGGGVDYSTAYVKYPYVSHGGSGGYNRANGSNPSNTATRLLGSWNTLGRALTNGANFGNPIAQLGKGEYADTYISGDDIAGGGGGGGASRVPYSPYTYNGAGGRGGNRRNVPSATSGNSGFISIFF